MNFEIPSDDVRLTHLNVRSERHGPEDRTAIDLKLSWTTGSEVLAQFHPELRRFLYSEAGERNRQQQKVEGLEPAMTVRAFPALGAVHWHEEVTGLQLTIHHGLGGKSDLLLPDCSADRFTIEALDGGSVEIKFRVRTVCEDERALGKLALLIKRDLPLQIESTQDELMQRDIDDAEEDEVQAPKKVTARQKRGQVERAFLATE